MAKYPFASNYGVSWNYQGHLNGTAASKSFPGVDYLTPYGSEIYAPEDGKLGDYTDQFGGRYAVLLVKGDKERWDFLHVKDVNVEKGTWRNVKAGEVIAWAGNTGLVSPTPTPQNPLAGTHTHVSFRLNGQFQDAEPIIQGYWNERAVVPQPQQTNSEEINRVKEQLKAAEDAKLEVMKKADELAREKAEIIKQFEVSTLENNNTYLAKLAEKQLEIDTLKSEAQTELQLDIHTGTSEYIEQVFEKAIRPEAKSTLERLINSWGEFVDKKALWIKGDAQRNLVKGFLKYNIFIILFGGVIYLSLTLPSILTGVELNPWVVSALVAISGFLGTVAKDMLPSYDTNKDGILDHNDFKFTVNE